MSQVTLTPEAKALLSSTIRYLHDRLIDDLVKQAEGDYRLGVPASQARLPEAQARRRATLEAWIDERLRSAKTKGKESPAEARARLLAQAAKETAATWLNRLVLLKHLEAMGLSKPMVVTGGWNSPGYRRFREFGPALLSGSDTEGYALLLQLLFEEHAIDLPGLFGEVGLERLFPLPAATLRELVEKLDDKGLESAWKDDTTLGWVYQYWNDPDREALDKKINEGGKIEPDEIASKTQMFTERYMVEWLLHNSLGPTWLAICEKNGWKADAHHVLPVLEARRADWRAKREAGEVALDALMPIENELEDQWKYHVPQPLPKDAVEKAPSSIHQLKLLDPACGSGHFLVIAFDLLVAMYREEARHTGQDITDKRIAESILENNLFGVDIDPRAVQIAAAALFLKARLLARDARPARLNLVAPTLRLSVNDPSVAELRRELKAEAQIPDELTDKVITTLSGVSHLGSLLKVDRAIEDALRSAELTRELEARQAQGSLFDGFAAQQVKLDLNEARVSILDKLEGFLARHSGVDDLGLRLGGEQLAQGVRFIRMVKEDTYDIVVGNPPYQGTTKMANAAYVAAKYPRGKADLYAAFLERGIELARPGGWSGLLTMRGWMFLGQFAELRTRLLHESTLLVLGDVGWGAFQEMTDNPVTMAVVLKSPPSTTSVALCPTTPTGRVRTDENYRRIIAGLRTQVGRYEFDVRGFEAIEGEPVVYWWEPQMLSRYATAGKLGDVAPVRQGMATTDNARYLRKPWEVNRRDLSRKKHSTESTTHVKPDGRWVPYVKGAAGTCWFEPLDELVLWQSNGVEVKICNEHWYGSASRNIKNETYYLLPGIAFSMIGNAFLARAHRFASIIGDKGSSVYPDSISAVLCTMNRTLSREVLQALNPTISFQVGDVSRLPMFSVDHAGQVFQVIEQAFSRHESAREASVEFRRPGPSPWRYAQAWAQQAVDRPEGAPLPPYVEELDPPEPVAWVSYAFGVAMGRFRANGEGILEQAPPTALPAGILFLSARADEGGKDSLDHPACKMLHDAWAEHGAKVGEGDDLRTYLRKSFFAHVKDTYENRPIYFPLSSKQKNFVAWVSIHRFEEQAGSNALSTLLADHLVPERRAIDAELEELRKAKAVGEGKAKAAAEKRFDKLKKLADELDDFLGKVAQCADKGPSRAEKEPEREVDARYAMDLDDGVMVNSAALWPLLEPQWKDPKKWWKELASAQGRKDYDWSHLAARYFPTRVAAKCVEDPSLAVAHGCFWRLHPEKAYAWELRLQDEIKPEFTIDEADSDACRAEFLNKHKDKAREIEAKERQRRERKAAKKEEEEQLALTEGVGDEEATEPENDA